MAIRIVLSAVVSLLLLGTTAQADTAQIIQSAAADYREGHVLDAETSLQSAMQSATDAKDRWALTNFLADICTYSFDYACVASVCGLLPVRLTPS